MPVVFLIRHGENDVMHSSLAGRLPGVHLNERGRKQSNDLVELLKNQPLRAIYSSPLERAIETAEPLAFATSQKIQIEPRLLEIDYGRWQGRTYKQLQRLKAWQLLHKEPSQVQFPGGETLPGAQRRITTCLDEIAKNHAEQDILVCFTHADVIRLAVAYYLRIQLDDFQRLSVLPASVSGLKLGGETPQLLFMNLTSGTLPEMGK